jgi:transglutaminase-like putative cysteine protease
MGFLRHLSFAFLRIWPPLILGLWVVVMGLLVRDVRREARGAGLAVDLARYGTAAQWRGIYLRGEKIGFSVTQTRPLPDGYEIEEDGRLRMSLLGMSTVTRLRSVVQVDRDFALRSFSYSLDPGTGPVLVQGRVDGRRLQLTFRTAGSTREEARDLAERPTLAVNLTRQIVAAGLSVGKRFDVALFDPLTLTNAPATVEVVGRDVLFLGGLPLPTYRLRSRFIGLEATMWVTETGEVVREESPLGMVVLKEDARQATLLGAPGAARADLLEIASVVPHSKFPIPDPNAVQRLRVRIEGAGDLLAGANVSGAGQKLLTANTLEVRLATLKEPQPVDPDLRRYLAAEPFLESDDPAIRAEAAKAVAGANGTAARAERLVRYVHALIDKRPTVSLPSAAEVLRTRVGDCNEHTVLYVAMARGADIPARIAVGLVYLLGAFHYHAWAEVYVEDPPGRGLWLPVDPTLNQFPADATHIRLARGGLEQQAALVASIGKIRIETLDVQLRPGSEGVVVGRERTDMSAIDIPLPRRSEGGAACWRFQKR